MKGNTFQTQFLLVDRRILYYTVIFDPLTCCRCEQNISRTSIKQYLPERFC